MALGSDFHSIWNLPSASAGLGGGSSEGAALGTGTSSPQGLEAVYEYNGLTMNVRSWYDTYIIKQIEGFSDADIRDQRESNPGYHGETALNALYGGRTVVITGTIRAQTIQKLRDLQQALRQAFSDLNTEYPLTIRTGNPATDRVILCKKSQPIAMTEVQQNFQLTRDFQVTLRASNPRILAYQQDYISTLLPQYVNLITNPSFEVDLSGWTTQGQAPTTFARQTGWSSRGAGSARLTGPTAAGGNFIGFLTNVNIPILPGQVVGLRADVNVVSAADQQSVQFQWFNAANGLITTDTVNFAATAGVKNLAILSPAAPANTAYCKILIYGSRIATSTTWDAYLDSAMAVVMAGTATLADLPAYFDGTTNGNGTAAESRWSGTAHASSSIWEPLTSFTVSNEGNFDAQPVIDIAGPITNPIVTNTATGEKIQINGSIPSGEIWTMDIAKRTLRSNLPAPNGANKFSLLDVSSKMMEYDPGASIITVSGTFRGASTAVTSRHKDSYI